MPTVLVVGLEPETLAKNYTFGSIKSGKRRDGRFPKSRSKCSDVFRATEESQRKIAVLLFH